MPFPELWLYQQIARTRAVCGAFAVTQELEDWRTLCGAHDRGSWSETEDEEEEEEEEEKDPGVAFLERESCDADLDRSFGFLETKPDNSLTPLPPDLWSDVAEFCVLRTLGALMPCSKRMALTLQVGATWYQYLVRSGWLIPGAPHYGDCAGFAEDVEVDWRKLLRLNWTSKKGHHVWLRLEEEDVRLPMPRAAAAGSVTALLEEVQQLLQGPLCPLRVRYLEYKGRPGLVVEDGALLPGAHLLLEPGLFGSGWPLPPHDMRVPLKPASTPAAPCWMPWLPSCILPEAPGLVAPCQGTEMLASQDCEFISMLRVISSLLRRELWLCVNLDEDLEALQNIVAKAMQQHSPTLKDSELPLQVQLMDVGDPTQQLQVVGSTRLRDLFWAHSETIRVEPDPKGYQWPLSLAEFGSLKVITLFLWREALTAGLDVPGGLEEIETGTGVAAQRHEEAVPTAVVATLQAEEALSVSENGAGTGSGSSESELAAQLVRATFRSVSEDRTRHRSLTSDTSASEERFLECRAWQHADLLDDAPTDSRGHSQETVQGRPGSSWSDFGPHFLEDASQRHMPAEPSPEESTTALDAARTGTSLDRVAQVLLPTLRTRQFEFHPYLPNVMLTGDRLGSANIFDLEQIHQVEHPSVRVAEHPILALVWLKRSTNIAVCGSANSGHVAFLKYNPLAGSHASALQRAHTVEEFPELTSLSASCTDDFLLASGVPPDVGIYDLGSGKLLQRACGVHDMMINTVRFCNTSPHMFVTASHDHTCKVWDLRQRVVSSQAVKCLRTGGRNVMATFAPDDRHILCSGLDTHLVQYEVTSWSRHPESFPFPEPVHQDRYRRSVYLADSRSFATAATEEPNLHILSTDGHVMGSTDLRTVTRGGPWSRTEPVFVQSIRAHPTISSRIAVLMSPQHGKRSCVITLDLHHQ